ncbi:nucleotidyl transferase AbiEii/AbiGii toxin family protein ['Paenibacillus yunnanensis' Narsing Rao et al. 2020]|uniref:nucleotidyl transferase AbiEii/AbiGii toxin family protein n=1 Tax=Paenibacillus tengchongensis TaxID=2608684 RepID=UPI00124E855B|nr:nucleotidyl transferase AbiEii/AbiGii toxin family protein [Paenibacillus tengchongensis]
MSDIKNIPASVAERLKNIAKTSGKAFDTLLLLYLQERFLYRLSVSDYKDKFILKGGLFLFSQTQFKARPTKDVDFLARQIANELETLRDSFVMICSIDVPADGVEFQLDKMTTERIKEDADYEGVRIKVTALLGRMRKSLQFDIGFGDVVVPKPQLIDYPVLLDMEAPQVQAYSKESVISEKFEAMITLSVMNSRMKDFYDIYMLLSTNDFDGRVLYEAVFETFQRRGTVLEKEHPLFLAKFADDESRTKQWMAFMRRLGIEEPLAFQDVMNCLVNFLEPLYQSLIHDVEFFGQWNCENRVWLNQN